MKDSNLIPVLAIITTALMAGLYYAYSCSVNPGLKALPDREYIGAMQAINIAIQNPVFFVCFIGTLVLSPLATYLSYDAVAKTRFYLWLGTALIYGIGSFGVTMFGNVPLNNALANLNLTTANEAAIKVARLAFEKPWNNLHLIRTIATIIGLILAVCAAFIPKPVVK